MYKSWTEDKAEWKDIVEPAHIAKVRKAIDANFARYFETLTRPAVPQGNDLFERLGEKFKVAPSKKPLPASKPDASAFVDAIAAYSKKAQRYRNFFTQDILTEFRNDDPDEFQSQLRKKCPVILGLVQSKSDDLKEWRIKYKQTSSPELLEVFENLINFAADYDNDAGKEASYSKYVDHGEFQVDDFDTEEMSILGVIGGGIKSTVLYHLNPRVFPERSDAAMFALFFLTDKSPFSLRSKTSEFLQIDDRKLGRDVNLKMDHNYWYGYPLFCSYAMQVARRLEDACRTVHIDFDVEHRYVYVDAYFDHICEVHADELKVMRGVDDLKQLSWAAK